MEIISRVICMYDDKSTMCYVDCYLIHHMFSANGKTPRSSLTWNDTVNGNKENSLLAMDQDIPRTFPELKVM